MTDLILLLPPATEQIEFGGDSLSSGGPNTLPRIQCWLVSFWTESVKNGLEVYNALFHYNFKFFSDFPSIIPPS